MQRHIAVLTGKRGGYGAMKPMLRLMSRDPEIRLSLIVTDQHLSAVFGATASEITQDFEIAARVAMDQASDAPIDRAQAVGRCLVGMAETLETLKPDILVLYGDRGEVLASATASLHLGLPIAHLQGGDVSGNGDELMRHAVTKLSHLHFASNEQSAARIRAMGEEEWRIEVVGDNHVDAIVAGEFSSASEVRSKYAISEDERPIVVLYHPETTRSRNHEADMRTILDAVLARGRRTLLIYPCSDQGYGGIVCAIEEMRDRPGVTVHKNINAPDFWGILAISAAMVGNSSAGLIETPYFGIPAIDVGQRQNGRLRSNNAIHCEAEPEALNRALSTALDDAAFIAQAQSCNRPFGDGRAAERIVQALKSVEIGPRLRDKRMTY